MRDDNGNKAQALGEDIAALKSRSYDDLRFAWQRAYRNNPPKFLSRDLLELGIAWKLQERAFGGLGVTAKRHLDEVAGAIGAKSDIAKVRRISLRPGARLLREWAGEVHEVLVTEDGFEWRGKTWRSLSVIAREMTGTRWSGPRFFGLDQCNGGSVAVTGGPANE